MGLMNEKAFEEIAKGAIGNFLLAYDPLIEFEDQPRAVKAIVKALKSAFNSGLEEFITDLKYLCAVNPAKNRPCFDHPSKFMCPLCTKLKEIKERKIP